MEDQANQYLLTHSSKSVCLAVCLSVCLFVKKTLVLVALNIDVQAQSPESSGWKLLSTKNWSALSCRDTAIYSFKSLAIAHWVSWFEFQGRSQPHSPRWARVSLSSNFHTFFLFFLQLSSFLSSFWLSGWASRPLGRLWLRHCWICMICMISCWQWHQRISESRSRSKLTSIPNPAECMHVWKLSTDTNAQRPRDRTDVTANLRLYTL